MKTAMVLVLTLLTVTFSAVSYAQWKGGNDGIINFDDPMRFKQESPNFKKDFYEVDVNRDNSDDAWDNRGIGHMNHTQRYLDQSRNDE